MRMRSNVPFSNGGEHAILQQKRASQSNQSGGIHLRRAWWGKTGQAATLVICPLIQAMYTHAMYSSPIIMCHPLVSCHQHVLGSMISEDILPPCARRTSRLDLKPVHSGCGRITWPAARCNRSRWKIRLGQANERNRHHPSCHVSWA